MVEKPLIALVDVLLLVGTGGYTATASQASINEPVEPAPGIVDDAVTFHNRDPCLLAVRSFVRRTRSPDTVVIYPPDVSPPLSPTLLDACPDDNCVLVEESAPNVNHCGRIESRAEDRRAARTADQVMVAK